MERNLGRTVSCERDSAEIELSVRGVFGIVQLQCQLQLHASS